MSPLAGTRFGELRAGGRRLALLHVRFGPEADIHPHAISRVGAGNWCRCRRNAEKKSWARAKPIARHAHTTLPA